MRSDLQQLLLAAAVALAALLSAPAPATAETWSHHDPARDVYQQEVGRAPSMKQGDITDVAMDYQHRKFVLEVKTRDLHKEQYSYLELHLGIPRAGKKTTSRQIQYFFSIDNGTDLSVFDPWAGLPVDCAPVTGSRSYKKATLRIVVPQSCLVRNATKLTAGTNFYNAWRTIHGGPYIYTDDGLRKGPHNPYGQSPVLSRGRLR